MQEVFKSVDDLRSSPWSRDMMGETNTSPNSWDTRLEEKCFQELEAKFCRKLIPDMTFPDVAKDFPRHVAELVRSLPSGFRTEFLVDIVCSANGLCLRTWRDYVSAHWKQVPPDVLHDQLGQLPSLPKYLSALELGSNIVKKFPTLAREELKNRNAYADGGRSEDYEAKYGCIIPAPEYRLFIAPQTDSMIINEIFGRGSTDYLEYVGSSYMNENDSMRRTLKRFPLIQKVSVGRQRSREPSPFELVFGEAQHRLIIADKTDVKEASREQMIVSVLTPQFLYIRNISDHFPIECRGNLRLTRLLRDQSCVSPSETTIHCNKIKLEVFQLDTIA